MSAVSKTIQNFLLGMEITDVIFYIHLLVAMISWIKLVKNFHHSLQAEFDQYAAALQNVGAELNALNYIKKWK